MLINRTEGKIKFNQTEVLFSSIKGAEINIQTGFRIVTIDQSKSKKHASIGGGLIGGALFGPIGAIAGGVGLGKTKTKGTSTSNQIPTCMHIGVMINVDGFVSELVLLSSQVDQSSAAFSKLQSQAQNLISQLGVLANTPVPSSFKKPEEESSVLSIDAAIAQKQNELSAAIADRPTYALPTIYRTTEQQEMTDAEYIEYLKKLDEIRQREREQEIELERQKKAELKEKIKNERGRNKEIARQKKQELKELSRKDKMQSLSDYSGTAKKIGGIIVKVIFWMLSVFTLLSCIVAFTTNGGIVGGAIFLLTAALINPLICDLINTKLLKMPRWLCIIIFVVGYVVGAITLAKP